MFRQANQERFELTTLKSLSLQNFRGFADHRIEFGLEAILIGQNNAGKTTVIEALRLVSVCQARIATSNYVAVPAWLDGICSGAGFYFSLETIDFDFTNVQHSYDTDRPAVIKAKNANHTEVNIYLGDGPNQVFCQLKLSQRKKVHSRSEASSRAFGKVKVMPPIGSLLPHEKSISKERLKKFLDSYLAYRHFRNQLWERPSDYRLFKKLLEDSWSGLKIQHFESDHGEAQNEFSLLVREGRFTSEVSWHGHGLQAWMQTIWFLSRTDKGCTVVLDEPDIYLHADLQRKLIKVIESLSFSQSIIATHSSEIIGDVPFNNVTVVRKRESTSKPAEMADQIQTALRGMGSLHSIQLAKVAQQGLVFFVEGDDKPFLTDVAYKLGPRKFDAFSNLALQEIKGKGNWTYALGASKALRDASGGTISTVLLLDNDYMLEDDRNNYYRRAKDEGLILKIWKRKEIENYFIIPSAIARFVSSRSEVDVSTDMIEDMLVVAEAELKEDLVLSYSDVLQKAASTRIEPKTAFRRAKRLIADRLNNGERLADLASGKDVISFLSRECQGRFEVSFSALSLCKEAWTSEIAGEVEDLIEKLCAPQTLSPTSFFARIGTSDFGSAAQFSGTEIRGHGKPNSGVIIPGNLIPGTQY